MLKNIDPLLNADVLYALCAMGHGDELILCDTNFPADSVARQTVLGRLLRIDGIGAARAARAILSVFPLDSFVGGTRRGSGSAGGGATRDRSSRGQAATDGVARALCLL
jgi:L-fucose mutarotase/ribose pyranase (RbsD/FucU family)